MVAPTWFENAIGKVKAHPYVVLAIVVILVIGFIWWNSGPDKKAEQEAANIAEHKGEANVIGNLVVNQQQEVNEASNLTNQTNSDLRNSIAKPSNSFNGNGASDRFCRDFPGDPSCR